MTSLTAVLALVAAALTVVFATTVDLLPERIDITFVLTLQGFRGHGRDSDRRAARH